MALSLKSNGMYKLAPTMSALEPAKSNGRMAERPKHIYSNFEHACQTAAAANKDATFCPPSNDTISQQLSAVGCYCTLKMTDSAVSRASQIQPTLSRVETRRYNVERSCIRCHRRKIRCDRSKPCSTCLKSDNAASCRYPGPERTKRKASQQHTTTLVQQVERLEQIVSDALQQRTQSDEYHQSYRYSSSSLDHDTGDGDLSRRSSNFTGLLIKDGNLVRYVNDHVLSHILEKVRYFSTLRNTSSSDPC